MDESINTVVIRDAVAADAAALSPLLEQLGYPRSVADTEQLLLHYQKHLEHAVLVAQWQNHVVGFAALTSFYYFHSAQRLARLASLVVDDSCRSQGIGEQLLHAAEKWAIAQHCDVLELSSNIKRVDAHRFYERLGYNKTGWRLWKALR